MIGTLWNIFFVGLTLGTIVVVTAIWFERKATARIQRRIGPFWVSPSLHGFLQPAADLLRIATQPLVAPKSSHSIVFMALPPLSLVVSMTPIFVIPLTSVEEYLPISVVDYSLILAMALALLASLPIVAMGWASGNKFAIIGSLRESYLLVTYDVIALSSIAAAAIAAGSLNVIDIVELQRDHLWLAILNPLGFISLILVMMLASSSFPFEIAESESEVVAGPYTEFSGLLYAMSMGGNYVRRYTYSILASVVFLGGWTPLVPQHGFLSGLLLPSLVVVAKALPLVFLASITRAIYGRLRLDQALDISWKVIVPMAIASILWSSFLRLTLGGWG